MNIKTKFKAGDKLFVFCDTKYFPVTIESIVAEENEKGVFVCYNCNKNGKRYICTEADLFQICDDQDRNKN